MLQRIPGMDKKPTKSWSVPLQVISKVSAVNYRVVDVSGKGKSKIVHVNSLKEYVMREEP